MTSAQPFAFGKLPAHGDFVARGLAAGPREAWDHWASEGLAEVREALGDGFAAAHGAAPAWRFVFGPSDFGPGWRAGALAPSIDRAGRAYLVILGIETPEALDPDSDGGWLAERMEDQIYRALSEGWDVDVTIEAARQASLGRPHRAALTSEGRFWTLGGAEHPGAMIHAAGPPADLIRMAITPKVRA